MRSYLKKYICKIQILNMYIFSLSMRLIILFQASTTEEALLESQESTDFLLLLWWWLFIINTGLHLMPQFIMECYQSRP